MQTHKFISKVISDGRITIPEKIRKQEVIQEGDHVEVQLLRKITTKEEAEGV